MAVFAEQIKKIPEREINIQLSRIDFYEFCKIKNPDFYKDNRHHLETLCRVLQGVYEGTIKRNNGKPYKKLIINAPPRFGKSRTLINFAAWVLGKNNNERCITCSYNDDEAQDFSRYTRDTISEEHSEVNYDEIVFSDIFPNTRIKKTDSSYRKWALENQFFNYKGAGIGGSITGKGGTLLIIDDPIKDAETAYNENALDKIWRWYTGTFLQRREENCIEIINHTRWSSGDLCGRILQGEDKDDWLILKMEAYDSQTDEMLCDELLSKESYLFLSRNMDEAIFRANYHQEPVDVKGKVYKNLKTYTKIPVDDNGDPIFEKIISYTDTADEGDCFLCSICAGVYQKEAWILDVLYTKKGMEYTEPATAKLFFDNYVNFAKIESNSGGRGFARNVKKLLWDNHKSKYTVITWFHQSQNKIARILSMSNYVMEYVYFPHNWASRFPEFYAAVNTFQKEKKNKYTDAPDTLTGLAEMLHSSFEFKRYEKTGAVS